VGWRCSKTSGGTAAANWIRHPGSRENELELFSCCLMTNHVHLVVQANDNLIAIPQLMKRLAGRQTRFVNALEKGGWS
jgi:REP element-mobilizing transposase RayT